MGQPAAKQGDQITATDVHIEIVGGEPVPKDHPFAGILMSELSANVNVMGRAAATVGSVAQNQPPHLPQVGTFKSPPTNRGKISTGSATVKINGKPAARNGDTAMTCNDPVDLPAGTVAAAGTVNIG